MSVNPEMSRGGVAPAPAEVSVELEHAISFAGAVYDGLHAHPNGRDFVYVSGACVGACVVCTQRRFDWFSSHVAFVPLAGFWSQCSATLLTPIINIFSEETGTTSAASRFHRR